MEVFPDKLHLVIRGPMSIYPWLVPPRNLMYMEHLEREIFRSHVVTASLEEIERVYSDDEEMFWKRKIAMSELMCRGWKCVKGTLQSAVSASASTEVK